MKRNFNPNRQSPSLRFSEFEDDWKVSTLGEYMSFKNGINAEKSSYGTGYKFINVLDILTEDAITCDKIIGRVSISKKEFDKNEVKYGDILFQRSSETREDAGKSNVYVDENNSATFGGFVIRGRAKTDYNSLYFNALLRTQRARKEIATKSGGSTRFNVGQDTLSSVSVVVAPTIEEQTKIASFLASVDKKISYLRRRAALMNEFNRGAAERIFSQAIRFSRNNGESFPNWSAKHLVDVFDERIERDNHEAPLLSVTLSRGVVSADEVERANAASIDRSNYKRVCVGDLAYNTMRMWQGASGVSKLDGIVSPAYTVLKPREGQIVEFWGYAFKTKRIMHLFQRYSQGLTSDTWNLKYPALSAIKMMVPHVDEQREIAGFLADLEAKREEIAKQIAAWKTFKKGLLQQMFL